MVCLLSASSVCLDHSLFPFNTENSPDLEADLVLTSNHTSHYIRVRDCSYGDRFACFHNNVGFKIFYVRTF